MSSVGLKEQGRTFSTRHGPPSRVNGRSYGTKANASYNSSVGDPYEHCNVLFGQFRCPLVDTWKGKGFSRVCGEQSR